MKRGWPDSNRRPLASYAIALPPGYTLITSHEVSNYAYFGQKRFAIISVIYVQIESLQRRRPKGRSCRATLAPVITDMYARLRRLRLLHHRQIKLNFCFHNRMIARQKKGPPKRGPAVFPAVKIGSARSLSHWFSCFERWASVPSHRHGTPPATLRHKPRCNSARLLLCNA